MNTRQKTINFIIICLMLFSFISLKAQSYEILYTNQINNSDNIHVINSEGKSSQITHNPRKDSSPMMSPDGNFMVFASERVGWWKIWLLDIKNDEYTQLTNSSSADYSPSWSPDGNYIVFVSSRTGKSDIFSMDRDGKNVKNLTKNNKSDTMPFWGNDNMIYYSSDIDGLYQIMRMHPDGSKKEVITTSKGDKLMPQLSNHGEKLLYYGNIDGNLEIYKANKDGSNQTRLTKHSLMDMRPRWSSDDEKIVFERGNKGSNHHIYIMDATGENVKQLTFSNYNYAPSFVPNDIKLLK